MMNPGMLHAVISSNNFAISGWEYVDAEWLTTDSVKSAGLSAMEGYTCQVPDK